MTRPLIAMELGPMGEIHHTGIPNVTKNLAIELLADDTVEAMFTFNRTVLPRPLVEKLVTLSSGNIMRWLVGRALPADPTAIDLDRPVIGIYSGHKWHRRLWPFEVQIVHDLTAIITFQYHNEDTKGFWNGRMFSDLITSDLIVAVSKSTEDDIRTYYPGLAAIPSIVSPLGPCTSAGVTALDDSNVEPYVAILGTLEPRKNVEFIFDYISTHPDMVASLVFLFIGRFGWGESMQKLLDEYNLRELVEQRRVRFTGFVSDRVRDQLIANARAVVYASRYEGFGLPVLEALSFGVPVITTLSSSLPEVGGKVAVYCDMDDPESFGAALGTVLAEYEPAAPGRPSHAERTQERLAWAGEFTWRQTYRRIKDAALKLQSEQNS